MFARWLYGALSLLKICYIYVVYQQLICLVCTRFALIILKYNLSAPAYMLKNMNIYAQKLKNFPFYTLSDKLQNRNFESKLVAVIVMKNAPEMYPQNVVVYGWKIGCCVVIRKVFTQNFTGNCETRNQLYTTTLSAWLRSNLKIFSHFYLLISLNKTL